MSAQTTHPGVRTTEAILAVRPDLRRVLVLLGDRGKCAGSATPQAWYAQTHGYFAARSRARRLCEGCPVLEACRSYALEAGEEYGVWGGLCEVDRAQMRITTTARSRDLFARYDGVLPPLTEAG
jgi:hypothetical protein